MNMIDERMECNRLHYSEINDKYYMKIVLLMEKMNLFHNVTALCEVLQQALVRNNTSRNSRKTMHHLLCISTEKIHLH